MKNRALVGIAAFVFAASAAFGSNSQSQSSGPSNSPTATDLQPKEPGSGLIDDKDPAWVWSGMVEYDDASMHGGSGRAGGPGTYATYSFHGTAVDVIGLGAPSLTVDGRMRPMGQAVILIDGRQVAIKTMQSPSLQYELPVFRASDLPDANHVIEIRAQDGWIVVDYIKVVTTPSNGVSPTKYGGRTLIPEGNYALHPRNATDKYLDALGNTDGAPVDLFAASAGRLQVWHFTPLGPNTYRISLAAVPTLDLCQVDGDCSGSPLLGLWHDLNSPHQQWTAQLTDKGYIYFTLGTNENVSMNVCHFGTTDGSAVVAFPQGTKGLNEQWYLVPVR